MRKKWEWSSQLKGSKVREIHNGGNGEKDLVDQDDSQPYRHIVIKKAIKNVQADK